MIKQIL